MGGSGAFSGQGVAVDTPLRGWLERATPARDGARPHFVRLLETGDDALLARIHLVRAATRSIEIQTFIWSNDESGRWLIFELLGAARRGVRVRVLIDQWVASLNEDLTPELAALLATAHPNLEAKSYNPVSGFSPSQAELAAAAVLDFKSLNQRMHNKVFVVDGWLGVTGGRNVENDYFDCGERRNYRDRDVLVAGPVAADMRESFEAYWAYERSVPMAQLEDVAEVIAGGAVPKLDAGQGIDLVGSLSGIDAAASDPVEVQRRLVEGAFRVTKLRFIADLPGKNPSGGLSGGGRSSETLADLLAGAQRKLVLQSPYVVFDAGTLESIESLRNARPDIDILVSTNSLASTDNLTAYALARKQRERVVGDLRLRIFELEPEPADFALLCPHQPALRERLAAKVARGETLPSLDDNKFEANGVHLSLHAKSYVVDGQTAWIGSFNLDPRSDNLNTEVALVIEDEEVARAVEASILRDTAPGNSWAIGPREAKQLPSNPADLVDALLGQARSLGLGTFAYSECFELRPGEAPVPCFHEAFHERYAPVGLFPGVSQPVGDVEMLILQTVAALAEPIL